MLGQGLPNCAPRSARIPRRIFRLCADFLNKYTNVMSIGKNEIILIVRYDEFAVPLVGLHTTCETSYSDVLENAAQISNLNYGSQTREVT